MRFPTLQTWVLTVVAFVVAAPVAAKFADMTALSYELVVYNFVVLGSLPFALVYLLVCSFLRARVHPSWEKQVGLMVAVGFGILFSIPDSPLGELIPYLVALGVGAALQYFEGADQNAIEG